MAKKSSANELVLSEKTLSILKNFAKYNEGILLTPGTVLKTVTVQKNVFATANIEETLPVEAAIYNLNEFLNCLSLFEHPKLHFSEKCININGDGSSLDYFYADKSVIVYPEKDIKYPSSDLVFELKEKDLTRVLNAARLMSLPNVCLQNNADGMLLLRAHDASNSASNKFDVEVGTTEIEGLFEVNFRMENLRLIELDYEVNVSFRGIARFVNEDFGIEYGVGCAPGKIPS